MIQNPDAFNRLADITGMAKAIFITPLEGCFHGSDDNKSLTIESIQHPSNFIHLTPWLVIDDALPVIPLFRCTCPLAACAFLSLFTLRIALRSNSNLTTESRIWLRGSGEVEFQLWFTPIPKPSIGVIFQKYFCMETWHQQCSKRSSLRNRRGCETSWNRALMGDYRFSKQKAKSYPRWETFFMRRKVSWISPRWLRLGHGQTRKEEAAVRSAIKVASVSTSSAEIILCEVDQLRHEQWDAMIIGRW